MVITAITAALTQSIIRILGSTTSIGKRPGDDTVPSGLSAQRRTSTATRVITPDGSEVIIEEEEVVDPRMRMILWVSAAVMAVITICVLFLAFGTLKKPVQPEEVNKIAAAAPPVEPQNTEEKVEKATIGVAIPLNETPPPKEEEKPAPPTQPVATQAKAATESHKGYLTVHADKSWRFAINGRERGSVPVRNLELAPGTYKLRFYQPTIGTSHATQVTIKNGKDTTYTVPGGEGNLFINANPWAKVSIGNESKEDTPKAYQKLPAGDYQVKAECENGQKMTKNVTVNSGSTARVTFDCTK